MHRSTCPFAAALFGSIVGSAAGAGLGAVSGWTLYAAYLGSGGLDSQGFALLAFGALGMGVGGSGGAVGGMSEGWHVVEVPRMIESRTARWGAGLGGLWSLQPLIWLAISGGPFRSLGIGLGVACVLMGLGSAAALLGGLTARLVVRGLYQVAPPAVPISRRCL